MIGGWNLTPSFRRLRHCRNNGASMFDSSCMLRKSFLLSITILAFASIPACERSADLTGSDADRRSASLSPPTNLLATALSSDAVRLTWEDNSDNEEGFSVERQGIGTAGFTEVAALGANTTSYIDSGLASSTTYKYRVRALRRNGGSEYSEVASVVTKIRFHIVNFPMVKNMRWLYSMRQTKWLTSAGGFAETRYEGDCLLYLSHVDVSAGGTLYRFDMGYRGDFSVDSAFIREDVSGLWTRNGQSWELVASASSPSFPSSMSLLAGTGKHTSVAVVSVSEAIVPAGVFDVLLAERRFRQSGEAQGRDISEYILESFAPGIGLVESRWEFSDASSDHGGTDVSETGTISLKCMENGPIPSIVGETEFADPAQAQDVVMPVIVDGNIHEADPGFVVDIPEVRANRREVRLVQDWYSFVSVATAAMIVGVVCEEARNDLDAYVFKVGEGQQHLTPVASSIEPDGTTVKIVRTLGPGMYLVGVQAHSTPTGRSRYWMSLRWMR